MRGIVGGPSAGPENDTRPTKDTFRLWLRALSFIGMVERLGRERLVRLWSNPDDRRSHLVRLTDSGRTTFKEMADAHEGWVVSMLSGLSEEKVEQLNCLPGKDEFCRE